MIKFITQPFKKLSALIAQSSNVVTFSIIGILVVLGPLFFFPVRAMNVNASKGYFAILITLGALLVAGITLLKRGGISFSKHPIFLILGGLSLANLLGAVLSPKFSMAFWGYGFETTTWLFITALSIITILSYKTIKAYDRIGMIYGGLFIAFGITAIIQIVRFIAGPATANLGVLGTSMSTLVGTWSDLGLFAGIIVIIAAITLQLGGLTRFAKGVVIFGGLIATLFLLVMNMSTIWIVIGLLSLLLVLYLFAFAYWDSGSKSYKKEKRVPWYVLTLFAVSLIGIFFGGFFNAFAGRHQNITWTDVRPSLATTVRVAQKNLSHNFLTGYGPNSFSLGWTLAKPPAVAGSLLADTSFSAGFSYVTSAMVTSGILGALLWVVFFVVLTVMLLKRLGQGFENAVDRYFVVSLAILIVFLSIMMWITIPGVYLLILWSILVGAFMGVFIPKKEVSISFIKDPRASFFGILGVTLVITATMVGGYIVVRKLASFIHDTRGMVFVAQGDTVKGVSEINTASLLASFDMYHTQLAQLALADASKIIANLNETNKQSITQQAEQALGIALGHAKAATTENPLDYKNWNMLGDVYRSAVTLGVNDATVLAETAYGEAKKRNPSDAAQYLNLAQLSLANKDTSGAYTHIKESIDLYPTRDAYLLRSQIQMSQQKWSDVVISLQQAIVIDQSNPQLYVYLGVAYEKAGDLASATKIYDLIKKQFKDGDQAISQIKNAFSQGQTITPEPAPVVPAVKAPVKTPVAPKVKK